MVADSRRSLARRLASRAGTVRVRTTVAAVVVVGVALLAGSLALVAILGNTLTREVLNATRLRAGEVAAVLESGIQPSTIALLEEDDTLVQVLDEESAVVASSPTIEGERPLARLRPGESAEIGVAGDDDDLLAVAASADTPQGRYIVLVARALEGVTESTRTVSGVLVIGLPVLLLVVAATTWRVVGRALAPVDAIRSEVEEISAVELHRRVPELPSDDEVARLASTMNRMLDRLEQAQARQQRFISDASHELRSPVASIRQHAEVALAHPERTTASELAETVLAEDLRVQRLVEGLLVLARADEHTLQLRRRPLDLDDLVFDEARRLRETTDLDVRTVGVSAGRVQGDAAGLARVVRNLGDNAARHAHSRISFAVAERNGTVVLS
nr:HAMP domain-containing protein [Actinomycetota bacterium]